MIAKALSVYVTGFLFGLGYLSALGAWIGLAKKWRRK